MAFENIVTERRGRVGLVTLNRPKQLNALNDALMNELGAALRRVRRRRRHRRDRDHRRREGVRGGRGCRRDEGLVVHGRVQVRFHHAQLGDRAVHSQACDRGGRRLCARRRMRAGDDVRHRHRRRQRALRPARNQARNHSRRRRHATPSARDRQGEGDGPHPDRPHDGRAGSRAVRARLAHRGPR